MVFRCFYFIVTIVLAFLSFTAQAQNQVQNPWPYSFVRVRLFKDLIQYPRNLPTRFERHLRKYEIISKENNKFDVIEIVPLNHYLAGVVSKEMPQTWSVEALKAQAVVARSYLFTRMFERRGKLYDVESDHMDQVFEWTDSLKAYEAVRATKDVVLARDKKVVKTFYHSDCGGQTVPADKVWAGAVDLGTTDDPWCAGRKTNQWSYSISVSNFSVKDNFEAGFFKKRMLRFEDWSIQKLRQVFGFAKIRSSPETVDVVGDVVTFSGRGFGHGVGLCQWGSQAMAKRGRSYMDILTHYYPKAEILKIQSLFSKNYLTNN